MISVLTDIVENQMNFEGNSFHFDYGEKAYINLRNDETVFPAVIYDTSSDFDMPISNSGHIGEVYQATLFFLYKSELDWTPQQHNDNCISKAKGAAANFINICQSSQSVNSITSRGGFKEVINVLDVNASGVIVFLEIDLRINRSACI